MSVSTEVNKSDGRHDLSEEQPRFRLLEAIFGHDVVEQLALRTVLKHTNKTWLREREKCFIYGYIYGYMVSDIWLRTILIVRKGRDRNVLFNDALNTFYLQLYGVRHMVKDHSDSEKGEREMFYLTTHSTHFIYGYMVSDIWLRPILIVRKERERNVLFNDALNTFYLQLYGIRHMVKDHSDSEKGEREKCFI